MFLSAYIIAVTPSPNRKQRIKNNSGPQLKPCGAPKLILAVKSL